METRRQDRDILSHQFRGQQGGGTSTHVAPWTEMGVVYKSLLANKMLKNNAFSRV